MVCFIHEMFIYLFCIVYVVSAKITPGVKCDKNVDILHDRIRLTGLAHNNIETSCQLNGSETVPSSTFFQFERTYTLNKWGAEMSESVMGFGVNGIKKSKLGAQKSTLFDVIVHNDKITLDIDNVNTDSLFCMASFASELPRKNWLLIRLTPLVEHQKTMISINVAPLGAQRFMSCIVYEYDGIIQEFDFTLHGITQTGMDQDVLQIAHETPFLNVQFVEHQVRNLQYKLKNAEQKQDSVLQRQWWFNFGIVLLFISTICYGIWKIKKLQKTHYL